MWNVCVVMDRKLVCPMKIIYLLFLIRDVDVSIASILQGERIPPLRYNMQYTITKEALTGSAAIKGMINVVLNEFSVRVRGMLTPGDRYSYRFFSIYIFKSNRHA